MSMNFANFAKTTRKIVCIGRNYVGHIKELNNMRPSEPFFFLKPPSSILEPKSGPLLLPRGISSQFEVELGLVVGQKVRDLAFSDADRAYASIAGYFLAIDMTARNMQEKNKKEGLPWTTAKGFDTYLPVSQYIEKSRIKDPQSVTIMLSVNGKERQHESTNLMIYDIPRILSHISSIMTLEQGDLILTGTPKGVGQVVHGDVMNASLVSEGREIEEGRIEVTCCDREGGYEFKQ